MTSRPQRSIVWSDQPPADWSVLRVKSIYRDNTKSISVEALSDIEVEHYSIPAFDETGTPSTEPGASIASNKTLLNGGELLFSKLNSHKPRVWLVANSETTKVASTEFISLVEWHSGKSDKNYVKYLFGSTVFSEYISCFQTAVTNSHKRIAPEDLWRTAIPFPSRDEQVIISQFLDKNCAAIDAAIEVKRRQITSLTGIKKTLIQRVATRGKHQASTLINTGNPWLEQIPKGWSLVMLKRLAEIQSGLTLGKVYEDEDVAEYPYLRVANVQDGYVDLEDVSTLEVPPAFAAGVTLRAGDVLMTEGGDLDKLGRGTVWDGQIEPCLHQNHVFAVRCYRHKLLPHFLAYVTAAQYGRDYFEATGKRTTNLAATNSTKVGMFYIPLPPLEEQRELVNYLDTELGRLAAIEANIGKQIETLLAYRKLLIHECVTGKRRITSADFSETAAHA